MNTTRQNKSSIANLVRRVAILVSLLMTFIVGVRAQKYYVIYYEDTSTNPATRHYLSISEDGNSVVDETVLSLRSYWVNSNTLVTAQGEKGKDLYSNDSDSYAHNQDNRKSLQSYVFSNRCLEGTGNQSDANNGTALKFKISASPTSRWLFDNEISETPIYFSYHYKHYIYYENGWKYSSKGFEKTTIAQIREVPLLDAPFACDIIENNGKLLVTLATEYGGTIYYTTDGSSPNTAGNQDKYNGPFEVDFGGTIRALAVKGNEEISSMVDIVLPDNLTITLNDLEDHTWNYYQEGSPISSPHPRNVKITYRGGGITLRDGETGNAIAAVGKDAPETSFVYERTLESKLQEGDYIYPYTTIANPFSKRPSKKEGDNPKQFYGFAGWKVKSINGGDISNYSVGSTIPAEQEILFNFTGNYTTNCISAEVELEAVWEEASAVYCSVEGINAALSSSKLEGGTYEKNFVVINEGINSNGKNITRINSSTINNPVTIMMVEPDGNADYRTFESDGAIVKRVINSSSITLYANTKFEYLYMDNNSENTLINAGNKDLIFGRGVASAEADYCANEIRGINSNYTTVPLDYQLRIESGFFNNLTFVSKSRTCSASSKKIRSILGCDYDRSNADNGKLKILGQTTMGSGMTFSNNTFDSSSFFTIVKSGTFNASMTSAGAASASQAFYLSMSSDPTLAGSRTLIIEGGEFWNIAGGVDKNGELMTVDENGYDKTSVYIRMKGGNVKGAIYGGGAYAEGYGNRKMVFTGGTVGGWIAAGCNGTQTSGGRTYGSSQIYVGGDTQVNKANTAAINNATKGQIFGAGKGWKTDDETATSGEMTYGTTVVIADQAKIASNVYGGGDYGYSDGPSRIYVIGGTIGGNVYGGSNRRKGKNVNIIITDGIINGSVFGASNLAGTVEQTAVNMSGGTVGRDVFGGGNEAPVSGNTTVMITGGTVNGDVFGGGNKATVSGTTKVVIGPQKE